MLPDRVFEISEKDKFNRIMLQNFIFDRLVMYNEPYLIDRHLNKSTFIYLQFLFFCRIAVLISVSQFFPVLHLLGSRFSVLLPSLMPKISRMFLFTGATTKYQVRPTSVIFYEKKLYVCNRSRILEVWIASKIRLRPGSGRDVGTN